MTDTPDLKLGLIGDNIGRSRTPLLHRLGGRQNGMVVRYDRLIPKDMGADFDTVFAQCAACGYRGINVTYPYKERAAAKVTVDDPLVRAIGAVNTVLFEADGPKGQNTDYTGFMAAYRGARGDAAPGVCCLIGTGGVGRALAFALVALKAQEIRLVDRDMAKAETLAAELGALGQGVRVVAMGDPEQAAKGAEGLLNGTPVGMVGHDGTPLPKAAMAGAGWAFDAVYTPVDTQFLTDAAAAGATILSGYELFFYQGVHAWAHFAGLPLDEPALRTALLTQTEEVA
ncbi:quinate/shikimate dehydrogenase (NAD(+)) (plasmid) [Antarctobacter heliothermus]|uniref:Quinate/shikimate dehydrogenase (NAD(+)) n=1 Tax=Antarctobacter heliothermus TaxID=74033 RepID=A0A222EBQ8_9RHOB|nr:shikimate dehydrogenase [Antarctobacter heliothermus]ASP23634.1 quinate/shikimate dehydrogenase (NAD(+)) [Antarctobacter heliothermus]